MEYEIATSRIQNRTTDQMEALGFTDESIENIRAYYDKVRDVQNSEAQKLAEANKERTSLGTDRDIDTENQRNKDRLKQIEDDYKEGLLTKEQYDRAEYESEVEEVAQMFGLKAEEVEELKSKALNKEITVEQFKEKLALKYAMNQLAKKPKVEDNSSEMSIIDEDEVELSNKPYGGYFEKYKNKK